MRYKMEKLVVIDGNFWLFSCYYATAAMGNLMVNKDGFQRMRFMVLPIV